MSNDDLLADAVKARLAAARQMQMGLESSGVVDMGAEAPDAAYTIELEDLNLIAARHHDKGLNSGYSKGWKEGHSRGVAQGERVRGTEDFELLRAIIETVTQRLDRASAQFEEPADGQRDRREKAELRREALALIDSLRGSLSILLVQVASNEFNLGES